MAIDYDDFRGDIGDVNSVFSDPEIEKLETRAIAKYGAGLAYEGAILLAMNQLVANAAKFADYTANDSGEKKQQKFKNLMDVRKMYKADLSDAQESAAGSSVRMGGTRKKPSRRKEYPDA